MAEFLFEIGLEEIPARMIAGAEAELLRRMVTMLERERLTVAGVAVKSFSTPRRLALWVAEVAERQQDVTEELLGPSAKIAYKDGVATPAAIAFARKAGVAVEALQTVTTPKGEYLQATSVKAGRAAAEVIAGELPKELAGIYWAKNMYWRAGKPERFVRPVRWLLALLDTDVVPLEFAGYTAANLTYGHRVLHGATAIAVHRPGQYAEALRSASVEPDVEARRHTIRKALDRVCRTLPETRWREDHALVDKLTHLTEWPTVIAGGFEPEYLWLPEEVLVTVMRDHQSYFAVEDKQGKLAPHFLAVLNTQADASGEAVIRHGNERVLRARFNDARFFWEFDQRVPLVERVALLEKVTFQKDLGSYAAKTERVRKLAASLAGLLVERGAAIDLVALDQATLLAKTDLTCELVKEFTELQGIVGGLYARTQEFPTAVSDAIYDQYLPASAKDSLPRTLLGAILGIADRMDTVSGMFGLGMEPSGSKDPFALRRAANSVVRILAESNLSLLLSEIIDSASKSAAVSARLTSFFAERVDFYLRESLSLRYDVIRAVMKEGFDDLRDVVARGRGVSVELGSNDFIAVCEMYKRSKNLLSQARFNPHQPPDILNELLEQPHDPQVSLFNRVMAVGSKVNELGKEGHYRQALQQLATLRPDMNTFFQQVLVMDPDLKVREARVYLLDAIVKSLSGIADFSEIVTPG